MSLSAEIIAVGTEILLGELVDDEIIVQDFGKQGKKALDASYAHLKKF